MQINKINKETGKVIETLDFTNTDDIRYEHTALEGFKLLGKGYLMFAILMFAFGMGMEGMSILAEYVIML